MNSHPYDDAAARIGQLLPAGPRLAIIGSSELWHADSPATCARLGAMLAARGELVLLTGGVPGAGEAVGRSFHAAVSSAGCAPQVFHLLPGSDTVWDYGCTLHAGDSMNERREILGRMARVFLAIEGGPGTVHEAQVAQAGGATVIPVGSLGGFGGDLYRELTPPTWAPPDAWARLGQVPVAPDELARAAWELVQIVLARV